MEKSQLLNYSSNQMFTSVSLSEHRGKSDKYYRDQGGKFFPYRNITYIDLNKY